MRAFGTQSRRLIGLAVVLLGSAYLVYPYVSLYRLGTAIQRGDMPYVMASVDWDSVRSGIADQVATSMTGSDRSEAAADALPAFGASFASSVATNAVNDELTPGVLAASFASGTASGGSSHANLYAAHLTWACFSGPTRFVAELSTPDGPPVKLRFDLVGMNWVLTRAWLPPNMLAPPHHT